MVGYTELAFVIFDRGYHFFLLGLSSLSSSTGNDSDKDKESLVVEQYLRGTYGGSRGGKGEENVKGGTNNQHKKRRSRTGGVDDTRELKEEFIYYSHYLSDSNLG